MRSVGIILVIICIFVFVQGEIENDCSLRYENHNHDLSNFILTTYNSSGICRLSDHKDDPIRNYDAQTLYSKIFDYSNSSNFKVRSLTYDANRKIVYYLVSESPYRLRSFLMKYHLKTDKAEIIFDQYTLTRTYENHPLHRQGLKSLTYDWISKNIFMFSRRSILVANVDDSWNITELITPNKMKITGIAVHPNKGYLFFINDDIIYRSHLDGSNVMEIVKMEDPNGVGNLVIDFYSDELYWTTLSRTIHHSKLDGTNVINISGKPVEFSEFSYSMRSVTIDANYVYYINLITNAVHRFNKINLTEDTEFKLSGRNGTLITEINIYDPELQKVRQNHPCENNGGCGKYCFAVPKNNELSRVCGCSYDEKLAVNGVFCEHQHEEVH